MKKILSLLLVISASVAVFAGCSSEESKVDKVNYVTAASIMERMDADETFAFVIGDAKCGACQIYVETLGELNKKEGILLDYLDLNDLTNETLPEAQELVIDYLGEKFEATPTTYFIVDGEPVEDAIGALPYETILEKYNSYFGN